MRDTPKLKETPSQTAGPYVHIGCVPSFAGVLGVIPEDLGAVMVRAGAKGALVKVEGHIYDGDAAPMTDAMVEIWQADANGLFNSPTETRGTADPAFTGWGRQPTDANTGLFGFDTLKPGRVPWPDGRLQAPHITVWIVARGINLGLQTRLYFADEVAANAEDPVLCDLVPQDRIHTLMATPESGGYRFDIYLQGDKETVFFDV